MNRSPRRLLSCQGRRYIPPCPLSPPLSLLEKESSQKSQLYASPTHDMSLQSHARLEDPMKSFCQAKSHRNMDHPQIGIIWKDTCPVSLPWHPLSMTRNERNLIVNIKLCWYQVCYWETGPHYPSSTTMSTTQERRCGQYRQHQEYKTHVQSKFSLER